MAMAVEALKRVLLTVADYEVAWMARDGADAAVQLNAAVEVRLPEAIGDRLVQRVLFK